MAQIEKRAAVKQKALHSVLPLTKINYQILALGIITIVFGYIALGQDPWNGTMPLVVAPKLLVLGYCVLVPVGILFRGKKSVEGSAQPRGTGSENSH